MTSPNNSCRLRTNMKQMLMRDKALQEEQRKKQKMNANESLNQSTSLQVCNIHFNSLNNDINFPQNNLCSNYPFLQNFGSLEDTPNSEASGTPNSIVTSVSELNEEEDMVVEQQLNPIKNQNKNSIKSSSSFPTMRNCTSSSPGSLLYPKYNLPSKLDPNDFPDLESYKKEKHNIVEKKRRYKINDCIQELATLLPDSYDVDLNKKKGYILEKSVEYILKLKKDNEKKIHLEKKQKELEKENKKLLIEIQSLRLASSPSSTSVINPQPQYLILSPSSLPNPQHNFNNQQFILNNQQINQSFSQKNIVLGHHISEKRTNFPINNIKIESEVNNLVEGLGGDSSSKDLHQNLSLPSNFDGSANVNLFDNSNLSHPFDPLAPPDSQLFNNNLNLGEDYNFNHVTACEIPEQDRDELQNFFNFNENILSDLLNSP